MTGPRLCLAALAIAFAVTPAGAQTPRPAPNSGAAAVGGFEHARHRNIECTACHSSTRRHGEVMIHGPVDCQACHHNGPRRQDCAQCHTVSTMRRLPLRPRSFQLSANSSPVTISIRFTHVPHTGLPCETCHGAAPARAPDQTNCASCHAAHHGPEATCATCHSGDLLAVHDRGSHTTCTSASCHGSAAAGLPNTRAVCLMCHTAQQNHMPDRLCSTCHPVRGTP